MAGKRESIEIPGMGHGAPIPMGSKIGNMVYSSGISGHDTERNIMPQDPDEQAANLFKNIRTFMEQAGGTPEDIIRATVLIKDRAHLGSINKEWLKMFPDEHSRPARHALETEVRAGGALFQIELVAVLAQ